ncbi:MAG: rod shape-determining protein MreD, partial [Candidatus Marinimicrobia bacterium]|nr:rod shape-determining protein MreD [Candidatus Neomarinimicrobiota bacterium]
MVKQGVIGFSVFIIQFLLVDFLSINMIRPDFMVIFIFYFSLNNDGYKSILLGFILGLLCDLSGVGSNFGLNSLTLSITAYLTGFLNGKYERLLPYVFHLLWIFILALHFFI